MTRTATFAATDAFPSLLRSARRSPDLPEEDDLYGFLIGSWDLDIVSHDDEGVTRRTAGEAHVARVLEGRAVQDLFINPRRADRGPSMPPFANWFGTTFRMYDPTLRAWRVSWFNPHDGFRAELVGRRHDGGVLQEGRFPDGTPIRWTFSEITRDSFRWRGERLEPDGTTWRLQVEFRATRAAESVAAPTERPGPRARRGPTPRR